MNFTENEINTLKRNGFFVHPRRAYLGYAEIYKITATEFDVYTLIEDPDDNPRWLFDSDWETIDGAIEKAKQLS
jgi:hypothetical protein